MTHSIPPARAYSDARLVAEVARLVACERDATAQLVAVLAEFDARRLYLPAGCSSMFTYCTQVLHLSEHAAYHRIAAARAARRHPEILDRLAAGDLTLTAVTMLAPHLATTSGSRLLEEARHKSKREIEHLLATRCPRPDAPTTIRKLPSRSVALEPKASAHASDDDMSLLTTEVVVCHGTVPRVPPTPRPPTALQHARPAVVAPLAPDRYKLQLTISRETHDKLRRAQDLLRNQVPDGDPAQILDRALARLVEDLERRKIAARKRPDGPASAQAGDGRANGTAIAPRPRQASLSRHIPAAVRRHVWARDGARCAFVGTAGRCSERGRLEFHHVVPYADGGEATTANLELRCRRHNQYEAECWSRTEPSPPVVKESPPEWTGRWSLHRGTRRGRGSRSERCRRTVPARADTRMRAQSECTPPGQIDRAKHFRHGRL